MMPKNRALLLEYLQRECTKHMFRRETYYLSQSYLDTYLEMAPKEKVELQNL